MGFEYEDYVSAGAERLPFKDATFDVAVMQKMVSYLEDPTNGISEACRIAKRVLIVGEPAKSGIRDIAKTLALARTIGGWTNYRLFEISLPFLMDVVGNDYKNRYERYFLKSTEAALPPRIWVRTIDRWPRLASFCIRGIKHGNLFFGRFGNNAIALIEERSNQGV